jgi:uncharacterized protein (DUF433 family)
MAETLTTEHMPLVTGTDGVMRIRAGRAFTLDSVASAFLDGATAEEIAQQYPSASLADVYQVIGYYLRHSTALESYFAERQRQSSETRRTNESRWPPGGIRERLLARRER